VEKPAEFSSVVDATWSRENWMTINPKTEFGETEKNNHEQYQPV